jgi:hypothetical protein
MSLIAALLPKSFLSWVETECRSRAERWFGLADRQIELAERELTARHKFVGIRQPKTIEHAES